MGTTSPERKAIIQVLSITPEQARAYLRRFELLAAAQAAELRHASVEARFGQLSALMSSRHVFRAETDREQDVLIARDRWDLLRQALLG
jgi:hypothetical protein